MLGLSVRGSQHVHVAVGAHASRLRDPHDHRERLRNAGATVHWVADVRRGQLLRAPRDILVDMAFCQSAELTIAATDSALRLGLIERSAWLRCCRQMPRRLGALLSNVDGRSESITESLVRIRLLGLGIRTRVQVRVRGVGRVDLVVGERLVIEVDGRAYHSDPEAFERDRRRDAQLSIRGFRVLRFSYQQVMSHWSEVKGSVLAAIARGDHLA
jgi:very-short-patch-repair endonuclease